MNGSGKSTLLNSLSGQNIIHETGGFSGELNNGKSIHKPNPLTMIQQNIWMLPEDRRTEGLLPDHSIMENMTFAAIHTHKKYGITLIISSGEIEELKRICDRIAVLYKGRLFDIYEPNRDENDFIMACSGLMP